VFGESDIQTPTSIDNFYDSYQPELQLYDHYLDFYIIYTISVNIIFFLKINITFSQLIISKHF